VTCTPGFGGEGVADLLQAVVTLVAVDPHQQLQRSFRARRCRREQAGARRQRARRHERPHAQDHEAALTGVEEALARRGKAWPCSSKR
jgi:hypothetical protein